MKHHFYIHLLLQIVACLCEASQTFYGLLISVMKLSADKLQFLVVRIKPYKTLHALYDPILKKFEVQTEHKNYALHKISKQYSCK